MPMPSQIPALRPVRSGAITAHMRPCPGGFEIVAPLAFDDAEVVAEGAWSFDAAPTNAAIDEALCQVYTANFAAWCAARDAERAQETPARPRRRFSGDMHTPCPALWAGR